MCEIGQFNFFIKSIGLIATKSVRGFRDKFTRKIYNSNTVYLSVVDRDSPSEDPLLSGSITPSVDKNGLLILVLRPKYPVY